MAPGNLLQELKVTFRSLRRRWLLSLFAALSLAVGIGSVTAAYSVIDAVDVRPLPYVQPRRLVAIHTLGARGSPCASCLRGTPLATFAQWRTALRSFAGMAAYEGFFAARVINDERYSVQLGSVSSNLPDVLGVSPEIGRFFSLEEERPGRDHVVVLSHKYWRQQFGAASSVLGATISITSGLPGAAAAPYVVIGVMPRDLGIPPDVDAWVPLNALAAGEASTQTVDVVARLKPGVTLGEARGELLQWRPESGPNDGWRAAAIPLRQSLIEYYGRLGSSRFALLGTVVCLLVLTLTNLASLLTAQRASNGRDLAIRAALGAPRRRLIVRPAAEIVLVVGLGMILGLLLADLAPPALARQPGLAAMAARVELNGRVVVVALAVAACSAAALLMGSVWHVRLLGSGALLLADRGMAQLRRVRAQRVVLAAEVAIAFVTLGSASVLVRELRWARHRAPGYDPSGLAYVELQAAGYRGTPAMGLVDAVQSSLGTQLVATQGADFRSQYRLRPGGILLDRKALPFRSVVSATYFGTLGIPVLHGRGFTSQDGSGAPDVALVNRTAAVQFWPREAAVGKEFIVATPGGELRRVVVIGVVEDAKVLLNLKSPNLPIIYRPAAQVAVVPRLLFVRSSAPFRELAARLATATNGFFQQPLNRSEVTVASQYLDREVQLERFEARVVTGVSAVVLLLTGLGVYGLAMHLVTTRWREIGVRVALGATHVQVAKFVALRLWLIGAAGLVGGLGCFLWLRRVIGAVFVLKAPPNNGALVAAGVVVAVSLALAVFVPLRRALQVDPAVTLRAE